MLGKTHFTIIRLYEVAIDNLGGNAEIANLLQSYKHEHSEKLKQLETLLNPNNIDSNFKQSSNFAERQEEGAAKSYESLLESLMQYETSLQSLYQKLLTLDISAETVELLNNYIECLGQHLASFQQLLDNKPWLERAAPTG